MFVRRAPFTSAICTLMLLLGLATGALWSKVTSFSWFADIGYGVPAFADGQWWAVVTGAFFGLVPVFYVPILVGFALFVGYAEIRIGTARTVALAVGGHVLGVVGAAGLVRLFSGHGWAWADAVARTTDVGPSAGMLTVAAAITALLTRPWRGAARLMLVGYTVVSFLYVGTLADLIHVIVVVFGLGIGTLLIRHEDRVPVEGRIGESRPMRMAAAIGVLALGAVQILGTAGAVDGPLGAAGMGAVSGTAKMLLIAGTLLLANAVRRGHRPALRGAAAICAVTLLAGVGGLIGPGLVPWPAILEITGGTVARALVTMLLWALELGLLLSLCAANDDAGHAHTTRSPEATRRLLMHHGGHTLSWMSTWRGNEHLITPDSRCAVAFRRHAGVAIAVGNPVARHDRMTGALEEFVQLCEGESLTPCLFGADRAAAGWAVARGWSATVVAQDAIVDLAGLQFKGKRWQDVRTALNRAQREGVSCVLAPLHAQPRAIADRVKRLSDRWAAQKGLPEMGFTLGGIAEATDPRTRVALATDGDGAVHAVVSWLPIYGERGAVRGWTLDMMRRSPDGFSLAVDFLIASSLVAFQREGAEYVSLSGAPLAEAGAGSGPLIERVFETLGAALEPAYGFRGLHAYKRKFQPRYEPMYLIYRDIGDLPRIGVAIARAYLPHVGVPGLVRLGRATGRAGRPAAGRPARRTSTRASRQSDRRTPASRRLPAGI